MKKNNYIAPMTEVINLYTEGMIAESGLSTDGGENTNIGISDEEFDNDFQSRKKGGGSAKTETADWSYSPETSELSGVPVTPESFSIYPFPSNARTEMRQ